MQVSPRVGLVFMRSDMFGCGQADDLLYTIEADTQDAVRRLSRQFDIQGPWIIDSVDSLQSCQQSLRETDLDMVLLAFQTAATDTHLVSLLQAIGNRPLVLWCYLPWRRLPRPVSFSETMRGSGPVGAFAALGTLRNLGVPFLFAFGAPDDPRLIQDLNVAGRAARVRQSLRTARFGLVPSRGDQMQGTFVDEFRLMTDFGPVVQYISVSEYRRVVDSLARGRIEAYLDLIRSQFNVDGVSDATLYRAAQAALGLAHLAIENRLDVVALNDSAPELMRAFGMRPALYPDLLEPMSVLFQPEGDLGAATANYILSRLTDSPTMFLEMWFWDEARNQVIGGHGGLQNPALADPSQVWISHDFDYCRPVETEGAHFQFLARPGRVTLFQLRSSPSGWQAVAASGVCLEAQPWVEGYPHAILRLDAPIDHFLNRVAACGATQHWVMAYGSVLHEVEAFCQIEKIELEVIKY
jgi:L-fucose isomerase-like protein